MEALGSSSHKMEEWCWLKISINFQYTEANFSKMAPSPILFWKGKTTKTPRYQNIMSLCCCLGVVWGFFWGQPFAQKKMLKLRGWSTLYLENSMGKSGKVYCKGNWSEWSAAANVRKFWLLATGNGKETAGSPSCMVMLPLISSKRIAGPRWNKQHSQTLACLGTFANPINHVLKNHCKENTELIKATHVAICCRKITPSLFPRLWREEIKLLAMWSKQLLKNNLEKSRARCRADERPIFRVFFCKSSFGEEVHTSTTEVLFYLHNAKSRCSPYYPTSLSMSGSFSLLSKWNLRIIRDTSVPFSSSWILCNGQQFSGQRIQDPWG